MANYINVVTPWGRSDSGFLMAPGITSYSTPSHGGVKVIKKLNDRIPAGFRSENGWYEEDCDAKIPFYFFHAEIEAHMTASGMPGWRVTPAEYFAEFTKEYFYSDIVKSGYWIPACVLHFGTVYSDERLDAYGRDKLAERIAAIRSREGRVMPKAGDKVIFAEPIRFVNGRTAREFIFYGGLIFREAGKPDAYDCSIRKWKQRDFTTVRVA